MALGVCGRVRVADRVKGVKRGGWTLNGTRSDTKEPCKLSKRWQKWGRSRKIRTASIQEESWEYICISMRSQDRIQAHGVPAQLPTCLSQGSAPTPALPARDAEQVLLAGARAAASAPPALHNLCISVHHLGLQELRPSTINARQQKRRCLFYSTPSQEGSLDGPQRGSKQPNWICLGVLRQTSLCMNQEWALCWT